MIRVVFVLSRERCQRQPPASRCASVEESIALHLEEHLLPLRHRLQALRAEARMRHDDRGELHELADAELVPRALHATITDVHHAVVLDLVADDQVGDLLVEDLHDLEPIGGRDVGDESDTLFF